MLSKAKTWPPAEREHYLLHSTKVTLLTHRFWSGDPRPVTSSSKLTDRQEGRQHSVL